MGGPDGAGFRAFGGNQAIFAGEKMGGERDDIRRVIGTFVFPGTGEKTAAENAGRS